ncbi:hypothetical protein IGJ02_000374 [Enterococcus sp. DIV0724b]
MRQPFIFRRQLVTLGILFIITFLLFVNRNYDFFNAGMSYLIIIISITFLPTLKRYLGYSDNLQKVFFIIPYLLPVLLVNFDNVSMWSYLLPSLVTGLLPIFFLMYLEKEEIRASVNSIHSQLPLSRKEAFFNFMFGIIGIVSEELYFRAFLMEMLSTARFVQVIIVAVFFVGVHYLNRWASINYSLKNYVIFFLLSVSLSSVYLFFRNQIFTCILLHLFFDISLFWIVIKRLSNVKSKPTFGDYD